MVPAAQSEHKRWGIADHANVQIRATAKGYLKQVTDVKMHLSRRVFYMA